MSQLNYLYRDVSDPGGGIAPLQANIDPLMSAMRDALTKVIEDTTVVADPTGDLLRQKLGIPAGQQLQNNR